MGMIEIVSSLVVIFALTLFWIKRKYSYWKVMGVPFEEPTFPYGNIKGVGRDLHISTIMGRVYNSLKSFDSPFVGMFFFFTPVVLATSLDFVRAVLIKDASNFIDRGTYYNEKDDPLSAHLFNLDNPKWKTLRAKLTPTFTSGKMKMMFGTVCDVAEKFVKTLGVESAAGSNNEIEIKDISARFTTDVIGSCAFGLDCSSLENPKSEFRQKSRKVFDDPKHSLAFVQLVIMFKEIARKLHVTLFRKETTDFFMNVVKETIQYREKNNIIRNDFMHLLIQLKNKGTLDGESAISSSKVTTEEIAAQAFIFFLAGFETSSTAMTFTLFELSQNQAVQDKARVNVKKMLAKHDALMEMTYGENCISESLRKYPPLVNLLRTCNRDYRVDETNFVIKKGQAVLIPVRVIQNDPEIYPNPSVYDPDRFTPEEEAKRSPYAFLPFGQGPRNCIGLRFGVMQAKIGLAMLLKNYKFEPCSRSISPIEYVNDSLILSPKHGVFMKVTKL